MAFHYSRPFEALLERARANRVESRQPARLSARVVIVGSGYGGSVAAYRLAELAQHDSRDLHVVVLERGREYALGEFPTDLAELPAHLRMQRRDEPDAAGSQDALFDLHVGENVDVLVGSGLGGTSLINANVALEPDPDVLDRPPWPEALRQQVRNGKESPLREAFDAVRKLLGVAPTPPDQLPLKHRVLQRYAGQLGLECQPAPIAVQYWSGANTVGIHQDACTRCGNCVTGCNVGAKSTLAMNLIPQAHARGAEFYTGALVLGIAPSGGGKGVPRWSLRVRATSRGTRARRDEDLTLEADIVVLAAGTLGSTGILQRSVCSGLRLSPTLGRRFSTNGDGLAMSFAGRGAVEAIGNVDYTQEHTCGPTITGLVRATTRPDKTRPVREYDAAPLTERFILEEGAIPAGLRALFGEIVTTAAQFGRLGNNELPGWFRRSDNAAKDPLAVHDEAIRASQVYLVMGHDDSSGHLALAAARGHRDQGWVVPCWPAKNVGAPHTAHDAIDRRLREQDRKAGLDDAQYVANPLWRTLPDDAAKVMSGRFPGGRLISVHPLGGCAMADSGRHGVVNHVGQVYDGDADKLHEGLYVLDGSIVPTSLGVNPFLTISALAWRACGSILEQYGHEDVTPRELLQPAKVPPAPPAGGAVDSPVIVSECLIGKLDTPNSEAPAALLQLFPDAGRWCDDGGLILRLETNPNGSVTSDGKPVTTDAYRKALLAGEGPVPITACLYRNVVPADDWERMRSFHAPTRHFERKHLIAEGVGSITVLSPVEPDGCVERWCRTWQALRAYCSRRESLFASVRRELRSAAARASDETSSAGLRGRIRRGLSAALTFIRVAKMQATYRDFGYQLTLKPPKDVPSAQGKPTEHSPTQSDATRHSSAHGEPIRPSPVTTGPTPDWTIELRGRKRIAYRLDHDRLWQSLLNLPVAFTISKRGQQKVRLGGTLAVDTRYMVGEGLLQVRNSAAGNLTQGLVDTLAFLSRFARCIVQAGFWEFGAPDYPEPGTPPLRAPDPPFSIGSARRVSTELRVRRLANRRDATVPLRLHRYVPASRPPGVGNPPQVALLVHGLAQGSLIYAHPKQPVSLAAFLLDLGYEVWLLDHRLSNQFDASQVPYDGWSMDEIAQYDIPAALQHVRAQYTDGAQLHVFAHCVGAVGMTAAILKGWVTRHDVQSLVLNAIHPWILPSPANDLRARLGVFVRDLLDDEFFDPIPATRDRVTATQSLLDRVAFSLARLDEDKPHARGRDVGMARAICDRMTFLYGRMWEHGKSSGVHPYWKELVGRAPGSVQRHLFYLLTRGRVLDRYGRNEYLRTENVCRNWRGIRTLFIHGDRSDVFNPQSASKAAFRLRQVLRGDSQGLLDTPVGVKRVGDFGHMDVILGNDAPKYSFPFIANFFAGVHDQALKGPDESPPQGFDEPKDAHHDEHDAESPLPVGPILRGARIDREGNVHLRVWFGLPMYNTASSCRVDISAPPLLGVTPVDQWPRHRPPALPVQPEVLWVDLRLIPSEYTTIEAKARANRPGAKRSAEVDFVKSTSGAAQTASANSAPTDPPEPPSWLNRLIERNKRNGPGDQPAQPPDDAHFLVGSCRYPGTPFDRKASDDVFVRMNRWLDGNPPCDGLFLIGDQIYADATAGIFDPRSWRDRYLDRYRDTFRTVGCRALLERLPVHFAVDDHEFANDFDGVEPSPHSAFKAASTDASIENWRVRAAAAGIMGSGQFRFAMRVGRSYLGSARDKTPFGSRSRPAGSFWYALEHGNEFPLPAFVLDTRTQRCRARDGAPARLMAKHQLEALLRWLEHVNESPWAGTPKFIFSGSVIAPLCRDAHEPGAWLREDGWAGYPHDLEAVVSKIVAKNIRHVVFVGGDLHLSCIAPLTLRDDSGRSVTALQVVASGLYAPLKFVNLSSSSIDWGHKRTIAAGHCAIDYCAELLSMSRAQFAQVAAEKDAGRADSWSITVTAHEVGNTGQTPSRTERV